MVVLKVSPQRTHVTITLVTITVAALIWLFVTMCNHVSISGMIKCNNVLVSDAELMNFYKSAVTCNWAAKAPENHKHISNLFLIDILQSKQGRPLYYKCTFLIILSFRKTFVQENWLHAKQITFSLSLKCSTPGKHSIFISNINSSWEIEFH